MSSYEDIVIIVPLGERSPEGDPSTPPVESAVLFFGNSAYTVGEEQTINVQIVRSVRSDQVIDVDWTLSGVTAAPTSGVTRFEIGESQVAVSITTGLIGSDQFGTFTLSNPRYVSGPDPDAAPVLGDPSYATFDVVDIPPPVTATDTFPLYEVYSNIMAARGWTPVPQSNTRYWEEQFTYPKLGDPNTTRYTSLAALRNAIIAASSDDVLMLANGTYTGDIPIATAGVTVCAETIGGVILNGDCVVEVTAPNVDFLGFTFTGNNNNNPHLWGRLNYEDPGLNWQADDLRIAFCRWTNMNTAVDDGYWVWVQGNRTRFCYNTFEYKGNDQAFFRQSVRTVAEGVAGAHPLGKWSRFDHNRFMNHLPGDTFYAGENRTTYRAAGCRYGSGSVGDFVQDLYILQDNNYWYNWNTREVSLVTGTPIDDAWKGAELNSIKSSGNLYIRNVYERYYGGLNHRNGGRNTLYANFFDGDGFHSSEIYTGSGEDDWFFCNYAKDTNQDGAALCGLFIKNGTLDLRAPPDNYNTCVRFEGSFNTFVNNRETIALGGSAYIRNAITGDGGVASDPDDTRMYNNVASGYQSYPIVAYYQQTNTTWAGNVFKAPAGISVSGITEANPDWYWTNGVYVPTPGGNLDGGGSSAYLSSVVTVDAVGNPISTANPKIGCFQEPPTENPVEAIKNGAGVDAARFVTEEFPVYAVYKDIMDARGYTAVPKTSPNYDYYWEWETRDEALAAYPIYDAQNNNHVLATSISDLNQKILQASPGKIIFLQDGNYSNATINIPYNGSFANRLTVCAQTKLGVYLDASSEILVTGSFIDIYGFRFQDYTTAKLDLIKVSGDYNRIAFNYFRQVPRGDGTLLVRCIYLDGVNGKYCRGCYNTFDTQDCDTKPVRMGFGGNHWMRFDHNEILNIRGVTGPAGNGSDDFEAIQTGGGEWTQYDYALCDNNYIYRHNNINGIRNALSEDEVVADKSSGNIFIHNVFKECCGHPNVRKSHRSTWYANFVDGGFVERSGGVFQGGDECWVFCNYMTRTADSAAAWRDGDDVAYAPSMNGEYSFNTVYDCNRNIDIGRYSYPIHPDGNKLYNNSVLTTGGQNAFADFTQTNTAFAGNVFSTPLGITNPGGITAQVPDLIDDNGYRVPSTGNCEGTGVTGWKNTVISVDILGNPVSPTNPNVGCFQPGFDLTEDPIASIQANAGCDPAATSTPGQVFFTDNSLSPVSINPANVDAFYTKADLVSKQVLIDYLAVVGSRYRVASFADHTATGEYGLNNWDPANGGTLKTYQPMTDAIVYRFVGDGTKDLLIDLSGETGAALQYPFDIRNYRNVLIRGVKQQLAVQAGSEPGNGLSGASGTSNPGNRIPRCSPYGGAFRIDITGSCTLEGVYTIFSSTQYGGMEGDFVIWRQNYSNNYFGKTLQFMNCRVVGQTSEEDLEIGGSIVKDYNGKQIQSVHSDLFHDQGSSPEVVLPEFIQYENFVYRTSQNGMIIQMNGYSSDSTFPYRTDLFFRNCDLRQSNEWENAYSTVGGYPGFFGKGTIKAFSFENVHYGNHAATYKSFGEYSSNFGIKNASSAFIGQTQDPVNFHYTQLSATQQNFAPQDKVGFDYVSPFGDAI
jgi:hypothetical protein